MVPFHPYFPTATATCFNSPDMGPLIEPAFVGYSEQRGASAPVTIVSRVTKGAFARYLPGRAVTGPTAVELWADDGSRSVPEKMTADPGPAQFRADIASVAALWTTDVTGSALGAGRRLSLKPPRGIARWASRARSSFAAPPVVWVRTSEAPPDFAEPVVPSLFSWVRWRTAGVSRLVLNSRLVVSAPPAELWRLGHVQDQPWVQDQPADAGRSPPGARFTLTIEGERLRSDGEALRLPGAAVTPAPPPTGHGIDLDVTEGAVFNRRVAAVRVPGQPVAVVTALIDWGDGSPATPGTIVPDDDQWAISGRHCYEVAGIYVATVSVLVGGEEVLALPAAATVDDAPFHLGRLLVRPQAALEFVGEVATLTDTKPLNHHGVEYTATICWGDGQASPGVVRPRAEGSFVVVGRHTYEAPGARTISVEVSAAGGRSGVVTSLATIGDAAETEEPVPSSEWVRGAFP